MPLPGGATDKIGNRYEGRWTVYCMIDVMDEKADSIQLEKAGEDAFEFIVSHNGKLECHQVKRQRSGLGRWTISALQDDKVQVLSDFWKSLSNNPNVSCIFVSTQDANELTELANRARDAGYWEKFESDFLNKNLSGEFNTLRKKWGNCSERDAFEALKRVRVETVGENFLVETIESRLAALVEGDSKTIRLELGEIALENIHQELTAHDIWHHLKERGYRRREWGKDDHVLAAVDSLNKRYTSSLRETQVIAGDVITRDEAQIAFEELTEKKQSILLVGEAGVGKSGVMLQVLDKLQSQGIPILTFRVDSLEPTSLPDKVGEQLGLPGSPAIVLANIAQKRDCVLIIDQLDAVSLASGRNSEFFVCLHEIIKQAQGHPNIKLLLACRKFDLDNDSRLKRLSGEKGIAKPVIINRFSHIKVREIVTKLGLDSARLSEKQINLLSVPLHLGLLSEIAESKTIDVLNFQTAKELYDDFLKYKIYEIEKIFKRPIQLTKVIDILCDYMSSQQQQSLSAPETVVDEFESDARAMASEHILIWQNKRISFFHESFFDYAFARRFASRGQNIVSFLGKKEEQHLFRRAQVRQILIHEREADFDSYINNIQELLTSPDIRFHIKQVVFALLATLNDPREEEWHIISPLIKNPTDTITKQVWLTLYSSVNWFHLLDSLGIIQNWLQNEPKGYIDSTIKLLSIMQRQIPDRIAELIEPFIGASEVWNERLDYIVQNAELHTSRRFFEIFIRLINQGIITQNTKSDIIDYSRDFWQKIYSLPKERPDWACEAISCYLNRYLDLSIAAGQPNLFDRQSGILPHSQFDEGVLQESARNAPQAFIQHLFPFILRVVELTAKKEGNPPWYDLIWYYRPYGQGYNIQDELLNEMEVALSNLATNKPEEFTTFAEQQLRNSNFETIQFLLIRAYTANGKRFADEAIDYLCEESRRLKIGYSAGAGNIHVAPYWATRQLIEASTFYCSEEKLMKLETIILNYYDQYEKSANGRWFRGYSQLVLLDAIHPSRRSKTVIRRLQEWQRKFTDLNLLNPLGKIEPPESIECRLVGSPIPETATTKMTDEQWLKAISKYDYNDGFQRTGELTGGAFQLSSLLESEVKNEPARFASLIWKFPDNANSSYFDAVLRGIAEVINLRLNTIPIIWLLLRETNCMAGIIFLCKSPRLDIETAFRVCQRCHQLPQRPCGKSIAWLFQKQADLLWTESALEILLYYALNDPNPEEEYWRAKTSGGQSYYGGDIFTAGINSTRGSAVSAIAQLIFADKNRAAYFQAPMEQIVRDSSIAVRSCAAEALIAMLNYDRDLSVNLFLKLCETEDELLGTSPIERFLYYALHTHFQQLAPILERMIVSDLPEVVKAGARQACLSSLIIEEAHSFVDRCLSGTKIHRIAAAEIFVANLKISHHRQFCENSLIQLFNDNDEQVRKEAAKCFFRFEGEELGAYFTLIEAFVNSRAFETDCNHLIDALKETTAKLPETVYQVCEKFVNSIGLAADIHTRNFGNVSEISELLIRLYSQNKDKSLRSRCLDLIDILLEVEAYEITQALQEFER
ncbi:ATP-binding protein [Anabaena catenula]|uniref:ATP-binding protein n=1 Tax=Anabaena catenula FACHB-362 TaxID=2692877 RepID=A0ABR8J9C1_9NOST|nr:ATP-binding protein [Anabaena catenula]MBD2694937.1 ATP-binding protein [Anabaena catenula FACHB-362]